MCMMHYRVTINALTHDFKKSVRLTTVSLPAHYRR